VSEILTADFAFSDDVSSNSGFSLSIFFCHSSYPTLFDSDGNAVIPDVPLGWACTRETSWLLSDSCCMLLICRLL